MGTNIWHMAFKNISYYFLRIDFQRQYHWVKEYERFGGFETYCHMAFHKGYINLPCHQ